MSRHAPIEAVIADMDGVLTRTATLHERAWKDVFDAYLRERGARRGERHRAFSSADYRAHVDGKPRYEGVKAFLASRGLELPDGAPSDASSLETICGLGNRKNDRYLALIAAEGVEVFEDAVAALTRWRRGGLKLAVVSASRNCRQILAAAKLGERVDVIVDGEDARVDELHGKQAIMTEAGRRLGIAPADAVVLEDATAGVRAARKAGFGLVFGVSRNDHARDLREAGADDVVHSVFRARFPRRVPSALDRLDELTRWQGARGLAVFLDFDGTLAPIVRDPQDARMAREMRTTVETLARRCPVAIISGRDREDVEARTGIAGLLYAGDHGLDIAGQGHHKTLPEAAEVLGDVQHAEDELPRHLGCLQGVIIERKRFSVAVHYRQVESPTVIDEVARTVEAVRAATPLRKRAGKMVFELEPAVDWNKGRALTWLVDVMQLAPARTFAVYIGDDETDEDAFAALEGEGAGIRVGDEILDLARRLSARRPDRGRPAAGVVHRSLQVLASRAAVVEEHAGEHRADEHDRGEAPARGRDQRRSGAQPAEPPADAEQRRAGDQGRVEIAACREVERRVEPRGAAAPQHQPVQQGVGDHPPAHHERQARVPPTGDVEEADHLRGLGHARDQQARAEQRAAHRGEHQRHDLAAAAADRGGRDHDTPPAITAVITPVVMKVATATSERADIRDRPHTPWPLVQPLPSRVPYPTSRPATTRSGSERTDGPTSAGCATTPTTPASARPPRNARRQPRSRATGGTSEPSTPLIPATRPWVRNNRAPAMPIRAPPRSANDQLEGMAARLCIDGATLASGLGTLVRRSPPGDAAG